MNDLDLSPTRKWAITFTVMVVTVLQILDTSITNVALPHMQGAMSASVEEISWVVTSYLAANAIVIPATGWLSAALGRRRFFLICTVVFTASSVLSGLAPNLPFLIAMRVLQGLGGGRSSRWPRRSSGRCSRCASGAWPWRCGGSAS